MHRDDAPGATVKLAPYGKATIYNADGTPYVFSDSSGDEIDPVAQRPVAMPKKLMSPYMEPESMTPVTYRSSREVRRAAGKSSYAIALAAYKERQLARAKNEEWGNLAERILTRNLWKAREVVTWLGKMEWPDGRAWARSSRSW